MASIVILPVSIALESKGWHALLFGSNYGTILLLSIGIIATMLYPCSLINLFICDIMDLIVERYQSSVVGLTKFSLATTFAIMAQAKM
jgi:hypothetical protein